MNRNIDSLKFHNPSENEDLMINLSRDRVAETIYNMRARHTTLDVYLIELAHLSKQKQHTRRQIIQRGWLVRARALRSPKHEAPSVTFGC